MANILEDFVDHHPLQIDRSPALAAEPMPGIGVVQDLASRTLKSQAVSMSLPVSTPLYSTPARTTPPPGTILLLPDPDASEVKFQSAPIQGIAFIRDTAPKGHLAPGTLLLPHSSTPKYIKPTSSDTLTTPPAAPSAPSSPDASSSSLEPSEHVAAVSETTESTVLSNAKTSVSHRKVKLLSALAALAVGVSLLMVASVVGAIFAATWPVIATVVVLGITGGALMAVGALAYTKLRSTV